MTGRSSVFKCKLKDDDLELDDQKGGLPSGCKYIVVVDECEEEHEVTALPSSSKDIVVTPTAPNESDVEHSTTCKRQQCGRCKWFTNSKGWQTKLPIGKSLTKQERSAVEPAMLPKMRESWLVAKEGADGQQWGVGCCVCNIARFRMQKRDAKSRAYSSYGLTKAGSLQLGNFKRHAALLCHADAVRGYLGLLEKGEALDARAPSDDSFKQVWKDMCRGVSPSTPLGIDGVGQGKKVIKIVYCLAEGMRMLDRKFLEGAKCISIKRDERDGRLLVRFVAANPNLDVRRGIMGMRRGFGTGATAITKATITIMKTFSSPHHGAPKPSCHDEPSVDKRLFEHVRNTTHQLVIDSASDERRSGRQMAEGVSHDYKDVLTPNLKMVTLDRAHASRRIVSRPFDADEKLTRLLDMYITGDQSVCQIIHNKKALTDVWQQEVENMNINIGTKIRNLGVAKHRFESISKPLGRFVIYLEATVATATWTIHMRQGRIEAVAMATFLDTFDEKDYLLLAMQADAADEGLMLTRFTDCEDMDLAQAPDECKIFIDRIVFLFEARGALRCEGTYTHYAVQELLRVKVMNIRTRRTFGLESMAEVDEIADACFNEIAPWVKLSIATVRAEFPHFDGIAGFRAFSLTQQRRETASTHVYDELGREELDNNICRVAKLQNEDEMTLRWETHQTKPIALQSFVKDGHTNLDAWKQAIARFPGSLETLRRTLIAFAAYGASSSGVEQDFSKALRAISPQQWSGSEELENDLLKVILDRDEKDEQQVIANAKEVWAAHYGIPRNPPTLPRRHKGLPRPRRDAEVTDDVDEPDKKRHLSEVEWLKLRRKNVADAAHAADLETPGLLEEMTAGIESAESVGPWDTKHTQELRFAEAKLEQKKFEAREQGLLLEGHFYSYNCTDCFRCSLHMCWDCSLCSMIDTMLASLV